MSSSGGKLRWGARWVISHVGLFTLALDCHVSEITIPELCSLDYEPAVSAVRD